MPGIETLVIPYTPSSDINNIRLLIGRKTRGIFSGNLVFPGGKPEERPDFLPIESVTETAVRELQEETGLQLDHEAFIFLGHLSIAPKLKVGELFEIQQVDILAIPIDPRLMTSVKAPEDSDIKNLRWRRLYDLPIDDMPEDYSVWLPQAISAIVLSSLGIQKEISFEAYIDKSETYAEYPLISVSPSFDGLTGSRIGPYALMDE